MGGTRFLGRALVEQLLKSGHHVTVLSRHPEKCPAGAVSVGGERGDVLTRLSGQTFNAVFDFIAYEAAAPKQVLDSIRFGAYIMISSTWVTRIAKGAAIKADEAVTAIEQGRPDFMLDITYNYLKGKVSAEEVVLKRHKEKGDAAILRLPIIWGQGDPTGRFVFYLRRIMEGGPVICVNGGRNRAQILWKEDIANLICNKVPLSSGRPILEALPDSNGIEVREIVKLIACAIGKKAELKSVSLPQLKAESPAYLDEEPLWREKPLAMTKNNLFKNLSVKSTPYAEWLQLLARSEVKINVK